jgi:hypothetical protein
MFLIIALIFNSTWFGMAFNFFSIKTIKAMRLIRPDLKIDNIKEENVKIDYELTKNALPFLGGMNLGFCILNILEFLQFL